jgi:hypothetical protein
VHALLDDAEEPVDAECVYYLLTSGRVHRVFVAGSTSSPSRRLTSMEAAYLMDEREPSVMSGTVTIPPTAPPSDDIHERALTRPLR